MVGEQMPGIQWFPNARLNFAEHVFRNATSEYPVMLAHREGAPLREISWEELERTTAALAAQLRSWGVQPGDRVASYTPNLPETVIAFLACASVGAIWSSCAPDMGANMVLDRLRQIEPKVRFAIDSYSYNGKNHDRSVVVNELLSELPSVERVVQVPGPLDGSRPLPWRNRLAWQDCVTESATPRYERLPFSHPLWILYSSGTTGLPKAIVHSHGGIVLTHLKSMALQNDLRPGDRLMFLGSTGWAVWNLQVGALLSGASIVLYDGNPAWPTGDALWRFMDEHDVTQLGCGAAYLVNCMKDGESEVNEVGELVITKPMPSMPIYLWNDPGNKRYLESYFETYPGVWRQGDWIRFTEHGGAVIYGRSDSTINRFGIRMGTAEIHRVVEEMPEVRDNLVIDLEFLGRPSFMPLFVVLQPGAVLDEALQERIRHQIRSKASARHVPNEVVQVTEIPRTLSGKKMEVPVRKLLLATSPEKAASPDSMQNPASLDFFSQYAKALKDRLHA